MGAIPGVLAGELVINVCMIGNGSKREQEKGQFVLRCVTENV